MPPWSSLPVVISHSCNQSHASCGLAEISLQVNRLACAGPGPTNQTFWIRMRPEPFSRHASTRSGGVPASAQRPRGCPRCRPSCRACRSATSACHPGVVARPSPYGQGSRGGRLLTARRDAPPKRRCRAAALFKWPSDGDVTGSGGAPVVRRRSRQPFSPSINAAVDDDRPTRKRREMPWSDKQAGRARSVMSDDTPSPGPARLPPAGRRSGREWMC